MAQHRILVIGAGGKSGTPVVEQAIAAGHEVTAFLRDPAKGAHLPKAAKLVKGDGADAQAVANAIAGHDTVIVTVGNMREPVCARVVRNAIAGMKAHGVKRIFALSAYGTADSRHGFYGWVLNTIAPKIQADKVEMEQALAQSGLDWTAVRPPALNSNPADGKVAVVLSGKVPGFSAISRADVAAFMLDQIDKQDYVGKTPTMYKKP